MTRESKYHIEQQRAIWYEPLLDEQSVRRNLGIPSNVTFTKGYGAFVWHLFDPSTIVYPASAPSSELLTGDISVEMKINPDTWGYGCGETCRILYNGEFQIGLWGDVNEYVFVSRDGVGFANSAVSSLSLNEWTHVLVTSAADGTTNIYINGVLSGAANQAAGIPDAGDDNLVISDVNFTFTGYIDYITIYNYVFSGAEAWNLAN